MKPVFWSLAVTGLAAACFVLVHVEAGHAPLRLLGAGVGVLLALLGALLSHLGETRTADTAAARTPGGILPRFAAERRQSPRHAVDIPVRMAVDGRSFAATLLSVSSSGALLRVPAEHARALEGYVGSAVRIQDYPAGSIARVGARGVYVHFAVHFDAASLPRGLEPAVRS